MVKVVATRAFTDASTGKLVTEGTHIECTEAASRQLAKLGVAKAAQERKPARKPARRK